MFDCLCARWTGRLRLVLVVAVVMVLACVGQSAPAAQTGTSLDWVPEDAALYSSMLRNREQIEIIAASRAWQKIRSMPVVQMVWGMCQQQASSPMNPLSPTNPQVQDGLTLLGDMFSHEVFVYAEADAAGLFDLLQQARVAANLGPIVLAASGADDLSQQELQTMLILGVLSENIESLKVPGVVLGFKVTDTNRAALNLGKVEMFAGILLSQDPMFDGAMKRTKIGDHEYLVLTLRGDMIPWDEAPLDELRKLEPEEGCVDRLVEKIRGEKLVVAIGLRGDYLLVAVGSSTDVVARLGQGKPLVDRPELAPVVARSGERLLGVDYISAPLNKAINNTEQQMDDLVEIVRQVLPSSELNQEQQDEIGQDAEALAGDLKRYLPEFGALVNVSTMTAEGIETFMYNYGTRPDLDATRPLGLLAHLGGTPLLAVVARQKGSMEDYDLLVKWLGVGYSYFERYGLPEMQASEREKFKKLADAVRPLVERLDRTNRESLLPALDGQFALVLDGRLTSKQFLSTLPATPEPMPMAEPALLLGVRDAELMRAALSEYWNLFEDALSAAADVEPDIADVTIPDPTTIDTPEGVLYAFLLPEECPVDKQVAPNVAVGKDVCVFSMSQAHSRRLLKATPLGIGGVLGDPDQPLAAAVVLDWAGLLKAATPWLDVATEAIVHKTMPAEAAKAQLPSIKDQVHTVIEVLSVVRRVTAKTYTQDGAIVTHVRTEIQDVE